MPCPHDPVDTLPSRRLRPLAVFVLALAALPCAAFDLDQLMAAMAQAKSGKATFTERREVRELERALESSGRLSFAAPDQFVRETLKPRNERLAVAGNTLTMSQGSRSRTVPLDSVPEAQVIVEAMRGTLTGNREVLDRIFTLNLAGSAEQWTLELVPRDARWREQVAQIRVAGRLGELREVDLRLADGDRSVMHIEPATDVR